MKMDARKKSVNKMVHINVSLQKLQIIIHLKTMEYTPVVYWLTLLHNFIQILNLCSGQVQILLAAYQRFVMVKIFDSVPGLTSFIGQPFCKNSSLSSHPHILQHSITSAKTGYLYIECQ